MDVFFPEAARVISWWSIISLLCLEKKNLNSEQKQRGENHGRQRKKGNVDGHYKA
jgi:hypothetical protein